jgi:hypothetical protein
MTTIINLLIEVLVSVPFAVQDVSHTLTYLVYKDREPATVDTTMQLPAPEPIVQVEEKPEPPTISTPTEKKEIGIVSETVNIEERYSEPETQEVIPEPTPEPVVESSNGVFCFNNTRAQNLFEQGYNAGIGKTIYDFFSFRHGHTVGCQAVLMAYMESGWSTSAVNYNRNGSVDRNVMQTNSVHCRSATTIYRNLYGVNTDCATAMWDLTTHLGVADGVFKGSGWSAWYGDCSAKAYRTIGGCVTRVS